MDMTTIGRQIAALRKEKGAKQEELANRVGVSAQAVSKWENGGVPDTELLPAIADFFGVSIDTLFGRSLTDYGDVQAALAKKIAETPQEDQFAQVMDYCWDMERALYGALYDEVTVAVEGTFADEIAAIGKNKLRYSSMIFDSGFTRMGLSERLQYFLAVPKIADSQKAFFEGFDYPALFNDFADRDVFEACVMLHQRQENKAFTTGLLVKKLGLEQARAQEVINTLAKYQLIEETAIELDDTTQIVYNFRPTPSFVAFLIFAREMIAPPNGFDYYGFSKTTPFL